MLKILCISIFLILPDAWDGISGVAFRECDGMVLKNETSTQADGSKIQVTVAGGQAPYKYIFYKESGQLLSIDYDSNTVSKLPKGKYYCTVADNVNCKKTIEIEIN